MSVKTLLIITQMYRPDPGAVGQYEADVAQEMVRRGWRVVVLTANRGYDDPAARYQSRETIEGVEIVRLPLSSFGKRSIVWRMLGGLAFIAQSIVRSLVMRRVDVLLISTVPPVSALAGIVLRALRKVPVVYWIMDLNPDQYIALGHATPTSPLVRMFEWMNRGILSAARAVVVLDRFMAQRVLAKSDVSAKMHVIPPWARDDQLSPVPHDANVFRSRHGLNDKFVVMYSGNHGPSNPMTTLLSAARRLRDDARIAFVFVGGGVGKGEVDEAARECPNILSLPYQPMEDLRFSLSAADVHAVTMGNNVVGIVHPSKIYGAFAVQRPILFFGPAQSHIGDMLQRAEIGWRVDEGDVDAAVACVKGIARQHVAIAQAGLRAKQMAEAEFGALRLCGEFCNALEGVA